MEIQEKIGKLLEITKVNTVGFFVSKDGHLNILTRHSEDDIHGTYVFSGFATLSAGIDEVINKATVSLDHKKLTKQWRQKT